MIFISNYGNLRRYCHGDQISRLYSSQDDMIDFDVLLDKNITVYTTAGGNEGVFSGILISNRYCCIELIIKVGNNVDRANTKAVINKKHITAVLYNYV